jgi:predicted MFS family arabinose efflux permease
MDWRASLALVGIISLAAAAAVFAVMPAMPGGARIGLRQRLSVLKRPGVMRILPLTVLGMAACYAPYAFTIRILETLRIPAASSTVMLFVYGLGAFAGNYASGRATDRRGPVPVLACAYGAMAIALGGLAGLAAAGEGSGFYFAAALIACWGASSWAQTPAQQHRLIAAAPQEAPLVIALNASGIYLGISAGTGIGSLAVGQGVPALLGTGSALALASLGYIAMTGAARRKAAASGAPGPD